MKTKPILFSTPMVQAILDGRKTQTRRIIKSKHESGLFQVCSRKNDGQITEITSLDWDERPKNDCSNDIQPLAKVGDILWVRETLYQNGELGLQYVADNDWVDEDIIPIDFQPKVDKNDHYKFCKIPSIYMPKFACRLFLEVTNLRAERLQDISESDAWNEGCEKGDPTDNGGFFPKEVPFDGGFIGWDHSRDWFADLWENINGEDSWETNPWVWVYEFKQVEKPENFLTLKNSKTQ